MNATASVELVFDVTCPNVDQARTAIQEALRAIGAPPEWTEWDHEADGTPEAYRALGSPTVLVNGRDVASGENPIPDANSCRVYVDACGCLCGAPSAQQIVRAIRSTQ
jgi:hypothetical protein